MKWFDAIKIFIVCYCCMENKDDVDESNLFHLYKGRFRKMCDIETS